MTAIVFVLVVLVAMVVVVEVILQWAAGYFWRGVQEEQRLRGL